MSKIRIWNYEFIMKGFVFRFQSDNNQTAESHARELANRYSGSGTLWRTYPTSKLGRIKTINYQKT